MPLEKLEELSCERDRIMIKHLKDNGWDYGCDSPGSYWYWHIIGPDGRRWTCWSQESAFDMQIRMEQCGLVQRLVA